MGAVIIYQGVGVIRVQSLFIRGWVENARDACNQICPTPSILLHQNLASPLKVDALKFCALPSLTCNDGIIELNSCAQNQLLLKQTTHALQTIV